jgi:E2/UBC family protein E
MALRPRLDKELGELRQEAEVVITEEADAISIIIRNFSVGEGFNQPTTNLLLRVPRTYPDAGPDMFWTTPELLLANGNVPQAAESMENYLGKLWRRFSWHKASWNPRIDNLHGYLEFIRRRLRDKK